MGTSVGGATKVGLALPGGAPLITASPDTLFSSTPTFVKGGSGIAVAPGATVADGVRYGGKATIPLTGGRSAVVNVAGRITPANLAKGVRALAGGPLGVAAIIGVPLIADWMEDAGMRANPDGSGFQQSDPAVCTVAPCYGYQTSGTNYWGVPFSFTGSSAASVCQARIAYFNSLSDPPYSTRAEFAFMSGNVCYMTNYHRVTNANYGQTTVTIGQVSVPPQSQAWIPATAEQLETKLQTVAPSPGVVRELLDKGIAIPVESPSVTGPSTTPGPQSQTNRPDGKVVTQTTTHNHTYEGDTITTTITNITNVYDPATNTTETTTEEKEPEDERQCKDGDQTVGCAELDTPEGEIPKRTETLTYEPVNIWGGGSCPADKTMQLAGRTMTVVDWAERCDWLVTYLKPMVIAVSAIAALFLLIPGAPRPEL